jgi:Fis family transcriptional regulator, factor for inversion stimulation protein
MSPHSSLQSNEIPQASVSETKLIGDVAPASGSMPLDADWPTLSVLSRRYIDQALKHTGGNKTRAADLLGIDRRTLNRILARERARKPSKIAAE